MIIDQQVLDELTARAKDSPRLRMNLDLRYSPTDRKSSIEEVVGGSGFRGKGFGRIQRKHIIGFAQREPAPIDLNRASRPERVAAY